MGLTNILTRAGCYIAIIFLGFFLRRIRFFDEHAFPVLSKLVIRVTLPAALIANAAGREIRPELLTVSLLGLGCGGLYLVAAALMTRRKHREEKAFALLNLPGYNIGAFALPFTQSFLGPVGVLVTSLFDVGNAFVCLGGSYGIATTVKDGKGFDILRVLKALCVSVPFVVHVVTVLMNLLHVDIPGPVVSCAGIVANANVFLAMLMIGVGFKTDMDFSHLGTIVRILTARYLLSALFALAFYFLLPFDLQVRQTLVILSFAPIGAAVPGFVADMKGDVGLSCTINSLSIIISIVSMVTLLAVLL